MGLCGNITPCPPLPPPWNGVIVTYADIGARGGPPTNWLKLGGQIHYYCFEPDPQEAKAIRKEFELSTTYRGFLVEKALGSQTKQVSLNLTRARPSSSILEPNVQILNQLCVGEGFQVESKVPVSVVTLDGEINASKLCLDFLKIDVQGYELEVLHGASTTLDKVWGCELEVSFFEIYEKQPLFAEVDQFMRSRGFFLADLERFWWRRKEVPMEIQERGTIAYGNALYLRPYGSALADRDHALKACIICIASGLDELAWEITSAAGTAGLLSSYERHSFQSWIRQRRHQTAFWFKLGHRLRHLPGRRTLARWLSLWARALEGNSNTGSDSQSWNRKTSW